MKRLALAVVLSVSITHFAAAQHHEGGSSSTSSGSSGVARPAVVTAEALILPVPPVDIRVGPIPRADRVPPEAAQVEARYHGRRITLKRGVFSLCCVFPI